MSAPGALVGRVVGAQAALGGWMIDTVLSGIATHSNTWEEVATGLEESSALVGDETPRAGDAGLFGGSPWCLAGGVQQSMW